MSSDEARRVIEAIRGETDQAADRILTAAEAGLRMLPGARAAEPGALDALEAALCDILEACSFQDLAGQRLSALETMLADVQVRSASTDGLLNGPALPGAGLDQAAATALMGASD